jgi:outer membrane protein assembly factor BamA
MPRCKPFIVLLTCFTFIITLAEAQTVTVKSITVHGLKRTRELIVHRELTFAVGDTLPQMELGTILERNQNNLLNLGLFNEAVVNISEWDTETHLVDILVTVKEAWYIYPVPIIELADRNFNVWWTKYNHELDRLNLGGKLEMLNFTGRNDKFKIKAQFGYTPKQEIEYRFPYFNRKQSIGLTVSGLHSINKEISYATINNEEQFVQIDERKLLERWQAKVGTFFRPNIFLRYELTATYDATKVDETIINEYNPRFFRKGINTHNTVITHLSGEFDNRDLKIYPTQGIKGRLYLEKAGFGKNDDENKFETGGSVEFNQAMGRRFQHRLTGIFQYALSRNRPSYLYYHGLGYASTYVRGYELYVVDGLDLVIGKYQFSYKMLEKKYKLGKLMPLPNYKDMALQVYLSLFLESGYVKDPYTGEANPLANQWLTGGGPGIDIVLYNTFLFQFNYSTNHLGEWGFFIHNKTAF